ncbi:TPA: DUF4440 domain-containing protein [Raoultella planticola]
MNTPYIQEVIDAHVVIENWLNPGTGSVNALMTRFRSDFTMIGISGNDMNHQAVSVFFASAGGSRPGLNITLDSLTTLSEWHDGAVISYRETQRLPGQDETVRWSTVLFRQEAGAILWRHLQETRQA